MKILLTEKIDQKGMDILGELGEVKVAQAYDTQSIIREGQGTEAILIRVAKITKEVIDAIPTLRIVAKHGVGVDNIDVEECTKRGIMVVNAPESNANAVAEHTIALIFALSKKMVLMDKLMRNGGFAQRNLYSNVELSGRTLGLIGLGNIAGRIAQKLSVLGMNVIAYDPYVAQSDKAEMRSTMDDILREADFVSLHIPLTEKTQNSIGAAQFALMKPTAFFVDVSRGGIVNHTDLCHVLKNKAIAGAGLDVYPTEPPADDDPLWGLPNVVLSPHNAALTEEALVSMAVDSATGIAEYARGEIPKWLVNRDVLIKGSKS